MSVSQYTKYVSFEKKVFIVGFGAIGQAILPLLLRHIDVKPSQVTIITKHPEAEAIAQQYGVAFSVTPLSKDDYRETLDALMSEGDFLLNLSVDVSSADLIEYCQNKNILYVDTCIEPWEGGYVDTTLSPSLRSCYAMRDSLLQLRETNPRSSTALVTHGANPGLVSHFLKQGLMNIAHDVGLSVAEPENQTQWAELARDLSIKVVHIAERDSQVTEKIKKANEFINTWSIDGFISELLQPAELGWGTHERHWPSEGSHHDFGSQCAIYLNRPGGSMRVRTWTPASGPFHSFLITHTEAIAISQYFTLMKGSAIDYRPTVHFAYHPCEDALLSLHELAGNEWQQQDTQRVLSNDIIDGMDELGVLLMGNEKGAYWFGSQLTIHEARELAPYNNATSLQVAIGALSGMIWVIDNPHRGIVEPDEIDYKYILKIATPYLGTVAGYYTDWTPLDEREKLFPETIDRTDPWQFINMRVN